MLSITHLELLRCLSILVLILSFGGCAGLPRECDIAPPKDSKVDQSITTKVGIDLKAFAEAPVKGDFESTLKNKVEKTFSEISDKYTSCYMLLKTMVCV
jgi:hypothetical protein